MNRLSVILAAPALGLCLAAAPASAEEPLVDKVSAGSGALMFQMGGLLSAPSQFDGIGVGGRYFGARDLAYRGAVGILKSSSTFDPDEGDESDADSTQLGLEGGVELTLLRAPSVYIYTGGLLQLTYGAVDNEGGADTSTVGLGVAGLLGANYFFTQLVSIGAEYRFGVLYSSSEDKNADSETTTWTIGTGAVGFNLAFWFH